MRCIQLGHQHLDGTVEALLQRIERADVVTVAMGQCDPADRFAGELRGGDERVGTAARRRVDQREAVVLANEKGVYDVQTCELVRFSSRQLSSRLPPATWAYGHGLPTYGLVL